MAILLLQGFGKEVVLRGKDAGYAGIKLVFLIKADPVNDRELNLCEVVPDESGAFRCAIDLEAMATILMHAGAYQGWLLAEPGKQYDLVLPPFSEKSTADLFNPYFQEISFHFHATNTDTTEINQVISRFDDRFDDLLLRYGQVLSLRQMKKRTQDSLITNLRAEFSWCGHPYFRDYLDYKVGLFLQAGALRRQQEVVSRFFSGRPVQFYNKAYVELFGEVFGGFFSGFGQSYEGLGLDESITGYKSYHRLAGVIRSYPIPLSDSLVDWIILSNLKEQMAQNNYPAGFLIQVLDSLVEQSPFAFAREWGRVLRYESTRLLPGFPAPDGELADPDGTIHHLSDYRGTYLLLAFMTSWSTPALMDLGLLNGLEKEFNPNLRVILCVPRQDQSKLDAILSRKNLDFVLLSSLSMPDLSKEYRLKSYPAYFLIDPFGNLVSRFTPGPQENFSGYFKGILKRRN